MLKVLSKLLTYKTTQSQDGAIADHYAFPGQEFRVSTMPTQHGERLAVRLMNANETPLYLSDLGLPRQQAMPICNDFAGSISP